MPMIVPFLLLGFIKNIYVDKLSMLCMLGTITSICMLKRENILKAFSGNSLAVQWFGLRAFTAEGPGSIPGWGTNIPQERKEGRREGGKKDIFSIIYKNIESLCCTPETNIIL